MQYNFAVVLMYETVDNSLLLKSITHVHLQSVGYLLHVDSI